MTDPPYGLKFMGKGWDHGTPGVSYWIETLRVLKPGGYLLSFGGTRTHHRLTCSIEDAGFEIRDCLMWLYGSGFPKGKGCLKPAWEPIVLARKPGRKVLPLGIAECKVQGTVQAAAGSVGFGRRNDGYELGLGREYQTEGRWPPNLLLQHHSDCNGECHADCVVRTLGEQSGESASNYRPDRGPLNGIGFHGGRGAAIRDGHHDTGTAARFYPQFRYCPKASRRDRNEGCEGTNTHSTVKPTDLMEWLVRLACPEGGTVLDPFMGSGSTGKACKRAGRDFIGIEQDPQWLPIARARIDYVRSKHPLFAGIAGGG